IRSLLPVMLPRPPLSTLFPYTTLFRSGLVRLAPEADQDVARDVGMLRVAREHALQGQVILAEELRAAAGLVRDREHAVDGWKIALDVAELVLHELAHARRAVHAGDDRDV